MNNFKRNIPYDDLPLLPPNCNFGDNRYSAKDNITASRALANLNGALTNLPNPQLFLDTIHLQEAKASSEIENIITTNDELYQSAIADKNMIHQQSKKLLVIKKHFGMD